MASRPYHRGGSSRGGGSSSSGGSGRGGSSGGGYGSRGRGSVGPRRFAHTVQRKDEERENTLYVGNLDPRVTEYMIMKLFSPFGKIAREDFFWHMQGEKRGTPRGYCFVEFEKKEDAMRAKERLNGKVVLNRPISVRFSEEKLHFKTDNEQKLLAASASSTLPGATPDPVKASSPSPMLDLARTEARIAAIEARLRASSPASASTPKPPPALKVPSFPSATSTSTTSTSTTTTTTSSSTATHSESQEPRNQTQ